MWHLHVFVVVAGVPFLGRRSRSVQRLFAGHKDENYSSKRSCILGSPRERCALENLDIVVNASAVVVDVDIVFSFIVISSLLCCSIYNVVAYTFLCSISMSTDDDIFLVVVTFWF